MFPHSCWSNSVTVINKVQIGRKDTYEMKSLWEGEDGADSLSVCRGQTYWVVCADSEPWTEGSHQWAHHLFRNYRGKSRNRCMNPIISQSENRWSPSPITDRHPLTSDWNLKYRSGPDSPQRSHHLLICINIFYKEQQWCCSGEDSSRFKEIWIRTESLCVKPSGCLCVGSLLVLLLPPKGPKTFPWGWLATLNCP